MNLRASRLVEVVLVLGLVWVGSPVVVPVVLAFYLAFILAPPCNWLERWSVPRPLATTMVFGAALAGVGVVGAVFVSQVLELAAQLKTYSERMSEKDRKSTRLNSSHPSKSRMPSSA